MDEEEAGKKYVSAQISIPAPSDGYAYAGQDVDVCVGTSEGQREVRRKKFDLSLGRVHRLILSVGLRQRDVLHLSPVVLQRSSIGAGRMDAGMQNYKIRVGGLTRAGTRCRFVSRYPKMLRVLVSALKCPSSRYGIARRGKMTRRVLRRLLTFDTEHLDDAKIV